MNAAHANEPKREPMPLIIVLRNAFLSVSRNGKPKLFLGSMVFLATVFLPSTFVRAQQSERTGANRKEIGIPYFRNYTPQEHGGDVQNWAIAQDRRGVMYFGNTNGVLEYDGVSWRMIKVSNGSVVRALARAEDGTIYVGAEGELGYLAPDAAGRLQYASLRDSIPLEFRDFADVVRAHATSAGVYFQTLDRLFLWSHGRMRVWKSEDSFHISFAVGEHLYIRQPGAGLMQLAGDSLQMAPDGEKFSETRIYAMLPFSENKILIGTRELGLFLYDGVTAAPFPTEVDGFLLENQLYHGAALANGAYALATLRGGVVIIDHAGRFQQVLDKSVGLQDNNVWFVAADQQQGLWLALNNGLARAETPAPLSRFDERSGLRGIVESTLRHRGQLYVATHQGVFYLQPAAPDADAAAAMPPVFLPVSGIADQSWALLSTGDALLAGTRVGVYQIENTRARMFRPSSEHSYALHRSKKDTTLIYVGLESGLAALRFDPREKKWLEAGTIAGVAAEVRDLAESANGVLWLGTRAEGYVRVDMSNGFSLNPAVEILDARHGLPADPRWVTIVSLAGREVFVTNRGLFRFDERAHRFFPDSTFGAAYADSSRSTGEAAVDRANNFWMQFGSGASQQIGRAVRQKDGTYVWQYAPFARLSNFNVWDFFLEAEETESGAEVAWFGGPEGLVRYDGTEPKKYDAAFSALIRSVTTANGDSIIFGGAASDNRSAARSPLAYANNALRFEFSATSYEGEAANQFQYFLEGFDKGWSAWTKETKKDYTNISESSYLFHVRAKNVYNHESAEALYAFQILPPWYRTWWAYLFYVGALGSLVYGGIKQRTRQLEQRSRKLEATVQERTAELAQQKNNIELLSQIGKDLTASLDFDVIFYKLYESINRLADATIFGVGIYHADKHQIEYRLAIEKGKRFAPYFRETADKNQFPVWCIENRKPVFINDVRREYAQYIRVYQEPELVLEDGTLSETPTSLIYLPLLAQERVLGVLTVQSYRQNAYTADHLRLLQNLAAYTAIALDNANAYKQLHATLEHLKTTQQQLIVQEKLASLGALTAGIAHEIKNPLNFVNNFAALSIELAHELREEIEARKTKSAGQEDFADLEEILAMLVQNAEKINHHGKRADSIVKSMMEHSRGSSGERVRVHINDLLEEAVNLTYHGLRAQNMDFNIAIEKNYDPNAGEIEVMAQDVSRVFLNILNNACYAAYEKKNALSKTQTDGAKSFAPTLAVSTRRQNGKVEIHIRDNGTGIPPSIRAQIFNPFFTTKPAGKGTGLGLSISYDIIVQQHQGMIAVESEEGQFTEFVITLPRKIAGT